MSRVSTLVGVVIDGQPKEDKVIDGEQFYTIDVSFKDNIIPVRFSSYVSTTVFETDSKVKVTGCLMSDIKNNRKQCNPKFYIYANSIELVDIDTECTDVINFTCVVNKVREFQVNSKCVDILPLVASDSSPLRTTSVFFLCAKHALARRLKNKEKGYTLSGKGHLKVYKDIVEIYIIDVDNLDEL